MSYKTLAAINVGSGAVSYTHLDVYKRQVGRYVSPTLFDYRERIQINDSWISKADTAYWMSRVRKADERMQAEGMEGASAFELEDVYKRQMRFLATKDAILNKFRKQKYYAAQRKDFHIYTCPTCKQKIRIPKGKGKISITCPKCKTSFIKKS